MVLSEAEKLSIAERNRRSREEYNAKVGAFAPYSIYRLQDCLFTGSWDDFIKWLTDNPTLVDDVSCYTDNLDVSEEGDGSRSVYPGFSEAEQEIIEEKFGILV